LRPDFLLENICAYTFCDFVRVFAILPGLYNFKLNYDEAVVTV